MVNKVLCFFDRAKEKWLRYYWVLVFRTRTRQKAEKCTILGKMTLINTNVCIGRNVTFYPGVMIFGDGPIYIGDNVDIGNNVILYAKKPCGGITIGNNTMIAANCYVIDSNHGTEKELLIRDQPLDTAAIEIGEDVWIASNCQIIKGASIADGAVVGAGSLVNGIIEKNSIVAGRPAKTIKMRQ